MPRLEKLGLPSLTPSVLPFFAAHGIRSLEEFLVAEHAPKLDETRSEEERQAMLDLVDYLERQSWGFQMTAKMRQDLKARGDRCLLRGWDLDKLLEGGLREGTVTELVGGSSSGKTQVAASECQIGTESPCNMVSYYVVTQ